MQTLHLRSYLSAVSLKRIKSVKTEPEQSSLNFIDRIKKKKEKSILGHQLFSNWFSQNLPQDMANHQHYSRYNLVASNAIV